MDPKPLEQVSLKRPFAVLAALIALSTAWAIWDEVGPRRPWKDYQREFFALSERHLRAELARAEKRLEAPDARARLEAARAELEAARAATGGTPEQRAAYEAVVRAERRAIQEEADAKLYLGFEKSEADAIYYLVREARHEGSTEEVDHQLELAAKRKEIAARAQAFERARRSREAATDQRLAFERRVTEAQARLDALLAPVEELRKKLAAYEAFPGRLPSLEQTWIPRLPNSWGGDTVDRCQNCHMAIDRAGFSTPAEVLEARAAEMKETDFRVRYAVDPEVVSAYRAVQEKICEEVPVPSAAIPIGGNPVVAPPPPADPAKATECRPVETYRAWLSMTDAYCGVGQRPLAPARFAFRDAAGAPVVAAPRAPRVQDFEHGSPPGEVLERAAVACAAPEVVRAFEEARAADPYDVKLVFRTHPRRHELLASSHPPEKFGCTVCHGGEGAQTKGVMHRDFQHGADDHHWNDPLTDEVRVMGRRFPGAFVEAKCEKCHREQLTVNRAPLLTRGKKLFVEMGCWGCHPTDGYNDLPRRGPTLASIASKTGPGWLEAWIANPRAWRPATRMPNFWPGAVDGASVPRVAAETVEQARERHAKLRAEEVPRIAAYLWVSSRPASLPAPPSRPGSAERGKRVFETVGCRACHVYERGSAARHGEASETRDHAPNLWNVGDKADPRWLYAWIKNPRAQWSDTKMPDLRLTDEEAADVAAWLVTLRGEGVPPAPPRYAPDARADLEALAREGRPLVAKYGCYGCHEIAGFETAQKIGTDLSEHGRKDPKLLDYGDVRYFTEDPRHRETYASWVWTKLHTPRIYAYELVETRMPQFDFTDAEALALLTFLKGQTGERDRVPREIVPGLDGPGLAVLTGERLVFWNGCRNCHEVERRGGVIRDLYDEETQSWAPPILTGEGAKVQPQWLYAFLKQPVPLRPWLEVRMPTFHFSDEDAATLVKYFASASRTSFPYVTVDLPPLAPERAREAKELFRALQCTKCHVVGKLRPRQDPRSAAPDFTLARQRLRPEWIPLWLRDPNALMEGTRMPSFWDMEPDAPAPHRAFGKDKQAQMDALRDLLMHLGEPGLELSAVSQQPLAASPQRPPPSASSQQPSLSALSHPPSSPTP
ncbi:MAG TPA: c-type cytochrome [Anaeromyxobacter sp.]|nr:c-type cytochrome [Anaeromyxobacter sp.]